MLSSEPQSDLDFLREIGVQVRKSRLIRDSALPRLIGDISPVIDDSEAFGFSSLRNLSYFKRRTLGARAKALSNVMSSVAPASKEISAIK